MIALTHIILISCGSIAFHIIFRAVRNTITDLSTSWQSLRLPVSARHSEKSPGSKYPEVLASLAENLALTSRPGDPGALATFTQSINSSFCEILPLLPSSPIAEESLPPINLERHY